jgi:putative copper export protein
VLSVDWDTVRLFLHVLAATVWVGGQLTLAALVPALRGLGGSNVTKAAARRFNQVAWPAFAVLVATGVWNMIAERDHLHGRYQTTLSVKLAVVVVSGVAAALHATARNRTALAVFGALTAISALAALLMRAPLSERCWARPAGFEPATS